MLLCAVSSRSSSDVHVNNIYYIYRHCTSKKPRPDLTNREVWIITALRNLL